MPSCNVQALMAGSGGFNAVAATPYQLTKLVLLCHAIQQLNPAMTCNVPALMKDAACFCAVANTPFEKVELQLLCELVNAISGTISGVTGVNCGQADPVAPPVSGCTIYYRSDNGAFWFWNGSAWIQFIAP